MIEQSIKAWIDTVITGADVKLAPYDGNRPKKDYITYQPMIIVPQLHSYDKIKEMAGTGFIDETIKLAAQLTVSINAYSQAGYAQLQRLHSSSEVWEARNALGDDISLSGTSRIQNLTGLGDEKHRARFQADFEFFITTQDTFTIHQLSEFFITGKWIGGDQESPTEQIDFVQEYP